MRSRIGCLFAFLCGSILPIAAGAVRGDVVELWKTADAVVLATVLSRESATAGLTRSTHAQATITTTYVVHVAEVLKEQAGLAVGSVIRVHDTVAASPGPRDTATSLTTEGVYVLFLDAAGPSYRPHRGPRGVFRLIDDEPQMITDTEGFLADLRTLATRP